MTAEGELRALGAVARRLRSETPPEGRSLVAMAASIDVAARALRRHVDFLRAEAEGHLPGRDSDPFSPDPELPDAYEGLEVRHALALLVVRARTSTEEEVRSEVERVLALIAASAPQPIRRGRGVAEGSPDADGAGLVREGGAGTSKQAAYEVLPKTGQQRRRILDAVVAVARDPRVVGLTDVELQRSTGINPNSLRPRRVELVDGGWLAPSGQTREHYGNDHTVWVLTEKATSTPELWGSPPAA